MAHRSSLSHNRNNPLIGIFKHLVFEVEATKQIQIPIDTDCINNVEDKIWLVSFMHYDIGYFDEEACRVEPLDNPFKAKTYVLGIKCNLCIRYGP